MKESVVDGRIKKALESRTDSVTMLESLDAISDFFGKQGNSVETRRALRQDLEFQNIQQAKKFLEEFGEVRNEMCIIESDISRVQSECSRMAAVVSAADENMKLFMQRASQLEGQRNAFVQQSDDIAKFLHRFQLTQHEIDDLSLEPSNVETFFAAFKRLRRAYEDCKEMVEQHQYNAGFELLELLGRHQDNGYQRLFEWVKDQCETISSQPSETTDMHLQTAVMYLREVPAYYAQCQDLVVSSRRSLIVRRFVLAMGQEVESRTGRHLSRPIDGHTSNTVRHISNMLAWVHQAIAAEEEFLSVVFLGAASTQVTVDGANCSSVHDLLVRSLHGLGRPLKTRILQSLSNLGEEIEIIYSIGDLLMFYENTILRLIPVSNSVQVALGECVSGCRNIFETALDRLGERLRSSSSSTFAVDTAATPFSVECAQVLESILNVQRSSLSIQNMGEDECACFAASRVISAFVHPLLQACRTCGNNTFTEKSDMAIFMVNNVCVLKAVLTSASSVQAISAWVDLVNAEISTWVDVLVTEGTIRLLQRSDMDRLVDLIELLPETLVASEQPGLGPDRVGGVLRAFYASLVSTGSSLVDRLADPDVRESTRNLTARKVASSYELVYAILCDEKNKYESRQSLISYSPEEVAVLLGCVS